eukprot:6204967-Pleurochrysis_carterae.AAC.5
MLCLVSNAGRRAQSCAKSEEMASPRKGMITPRWCCFPAPSAAAAARHALLGTGRWQPNIMWCSYQLHPSDTYLKPAFAWAALLPKNMAASMALDFPRLEPTARPTCGVDEQELLCFVSFFARLAIACTLARGLASYDPAAGCLPCFESQLTKRPERCPVIDLRQQSNAQPAFLDDR